MVYPTLFALCSKRQDYIAVRIYGVAMRSKCSGTKGVTLDISLRSSQALFHL